MNLSIVIIGKICSGKSSLARDFSSWLRFPIASFGGYLSDFSKRNGLPNHREALQDLGTHFINTDHAKFLSNVIDFTDSVAPNLIFEGVRHKVILDQIKRISDKSYSIFLDANEKVRLDRFIKREKEIDTEINAVTDFFQRSSHKVEQEVESLRHECDFIITTNNSYQDFLRTISQYQKF